MEEYLDRARYYYLKEKNPRKALRAFQALTAQSPQRADLWIEQANVAVQAGNANAALKALNCSEKRRPIPEQIYEMAMIYQKLKHFDRAMKLLNRLVRRDPRNAQWLKSRGILHYLSQRKAEAQKDLQQSIQLDPGLISAYLSLGAVYEEEGRQDQALELYRRARRQKPAPQEEGFIAAIGERLKRR